MQKNKILQMHKDPPRTKTAEAEHWGDGNTFIFYEFFKNVNGYNVNSVTISISHIIYLVHIDKKDYIILSTSDELQSSINLLSFSVNNS